MKNAIFKYLIILGIPGVIPGGATLHFTVELVEIEKNKFGLDHGAKLGPGLRVGL